MKLWRIKIVEPFGVTTWDFWDEHLPAVFNDLEHNPNTAELIFRATHIEATVDDSVNATVEMPIEPP